MGTVVRGETTVRVSSLINLNSIQVDDDAVVMGSMVFARDQKSASLMVFRGFSAFPERKIRPIRRSSTCSRNRARVQGAADK
jgi:hypothetical protein